MSPIIDFTLETGPSFNLLLYGILGAVLCWLIQDYGRMLRARGHLPPGKTYAFWTLLSFSTVYLLHRALSTVNTLSKPLKHF